jgi:plastocyanin
VTRGVIGVFVLALALSGPAAGEAAYEEIAVKDGGTLTGVVRFTGAPPKLAPIAVNKNRDVCGDDKPSEALIVGADRGVKGSVILLEGVTKGKKATGDVVIDNNKCLFIGHVTAAGPGDRVRVKNSDGILHNTHGKLGKPTVFNLALPNKDQMVDITRRLTRPGVVRILCDAHPHMMACILVEVSVL